VEAEARGLLAQPLDLIAPRVGPQQRVVDPPGQLGVEAGRAAARAAAPARGAVAQAFTTLPRQEFMPPSTLCTLR
jgi:hypothetical protein